MNTGVLECNAVEANRHAPRRACLFQTETSNNHEEHEEHEEKQLEENQLASGVRVCPSTSFFFVFFVLFVVQRLMRLPPAVLRLIPAP